MQVRDKRMLEGIEKHKYMSTNQIAEIYFTAIKKPEQRVNKARTRLAKMYAYKLLNRTRYPGEPYIYYSHQGNNKSHKINHYLAITDVLIQILPQLPGSSRVDYDVEVKVADDIITDLVISYHNEFRKESRTYYIEVELDSSGDIENKIRSYEDYLEDHDGRLLVVCKKKRIADKIRSGRWAIPVKVLDLNAIREQWAK